MHAPLITRHDLERRHAALLDLRRYLACQEREFDVQRRSLQAFGARYHARLGPLYAELGALDAQLQQTTRLLIELLRSRGLATPEPLDGASDHLPQALSPHAGHRARFAGLPPAPALPPVPVGAGIGQWAPPTLQMLYRRAAMRLHPDRAGQDAAERARREQQMMQVNAAYAAGERWRLEAMLLAAGEAPAKVSGSDAHALRNWLAHSEHLVQARLREVNDALGALRGLSMHRLCESVTQAEAKGLDPLAVMATRLRQQIDERRKELYIGQRLKPESSLARAFLYRRAEGPPPALHALPQGRVAQAST